MARSPLFEEHSSLGARFTDFGGWEMPLQYQGVLAEHNAVRQGVGVFDVSHLGRVSIEGDGTTPLLRQLLCNDIADVAPGRAQYSMVLNEHGGVEDDVIVWRWAEDRAWVLPNASNYDKVVGLLRSQATAGTVVEPLRESTALLAVQGPDAPGLLADVLEAAPGRFRLVETEGPSGTCWAAGTGYTGERGGEIAVANEHAPALWQALVAGGAVPCGLGARDTLRLEMGYPLWGQDLDPDTTPLEADLGWVVGWNHDFIGREALEKQQREGLSRALTGFEMADRAIARHGYPVRAGKATGVVASGNFSPTLGRGIGLAFLSPPAEGEAVEIEIRGVWHPARYVKPPFVKGV
ncbi:MAG TPA: glycine cleavage system aminomethyltransferase GcvT [Acidimicrobiia bacterium]|jgi:aminomethyltransferase|nr:glycine cleavage system aminomethyltransferase GcvT [Acidimicrobiia bacterium]